MRIERPRLADLHGSGIRTQVVGQSHVADTDAGVWLGLNRSTAYDGYANAQLDDYRVDKRNQFRWRSNVEMTIRVRFSCGLDGLTGTAGFGFWNAPIGLGVRSLPKPPSAAWFFFAGPNSNIAAAMGVPGNGWKVASMDAQNARFLALLPTAPIALPLTRVGALCRRLWPIAQSAMRAHEHMLPDPMDEWHTYTLTWTRTSLVYAVDGEVVHVCTDPPRTRMGFVAWIDNQYMVATPQGEFAQGVVPVEQPRSLEISALRLRQL